MQSALNGLRLLPALMFLIASLCAPLAQAGSSCQKQETPEFTVKRLYRDYAWQAIGNEKTFGNEAADLRRQSLPELQKYFEPGLAELISKTRNCTDKRLPVCKPGFDYIFAAHGRAVSDLDVVPMNKKNMVRVKFENPMHDGVFWLDYKMVQTPQGWRVADIRYLNNNINLRDSLTEALKQSDSAPVTQAGPAGQAADTPDGTVRRLYRDYAWEGVGSADLDCSLTGLEEQTLPELRKYFDDGLASRLRADRECTERVHGACNLDYPIILGISLAQDPMVYDLAISEANKENQVLVAFKYPTNDEPFKLRYDMVKTDDGWRIHDIYDLKLKIYLRGRFPDKPSAEEAGAGDEFSSVRCGANIAGALLGKSVKAGEVRIIEGRHKDIGLEHLGVDKISAILYLSEWRICGMEYYLLIDGNYTIREALPFPAHDVNSPALIGYCTVNGEQTPEVIYAVLTKEAGMKTYPAKAAWRLDEKRQKFVAVPVDGMRCSKDEIFTVDR